eukprot:scaffold129281_cov44-Prasinocladus_malaysianus.AAC.1
MGSLDVHRSAWQADELPDAIVCTYEEEHSQSQSMKASTVQAAGDPTAMLCLKDCPDPWLQAHSQSWKNDSTDAAPAHSGNWDLHESGLQSSRVRMDDMEAVVQSAPALSQQSQ